MTPEGREVWAIAHRGASRDRPENTLAAFDEALRQGSDGIELDLQHTRDGAAVVYHDRTLSKIGGGRRRVASTTLEELRRLDAGAWFSREWAGQRVPTLAEVVERYADRTRLLLEVKLRGTREGQLRLLEGVAQALDRRKAERRAWLLCFDLELLREARRVAPWLPRVLNVSPRRFGAAELDAAASDLWALSADVRGLTPAFGAAVRGHGLPLVTYTCNSARQVRRALAAGARGVISDRPGWLAELLRQAAAGTAG